MSTTIRINDFALNPSSVHAIPFYGKLSGKDLPAMHLNFQVSDAKSVEAVENLLSQETVQINDPFTKQTYPASFRMNSSSYGDDPSERDYTCEIKALDVAPEYKVLEIEGNEFSVLKSREEVIADQSQEGIYRVILLRLTHVQFITLQELLESHKPLSIRRMGVDEQPLIVRHGSKMYWSKHKEGGETFYKHIVRLIQPSDYPSSKLRLLLETDQDILFRMITALSTRFERLTNELVASGAISSEKRTMLLSENWDELLDKQRVNEMVRETCRIADAEEELE